MATLAALSFWQPYAWLIVNGHATVDSRLWAPPEKRLDTTIAIHASKRKVTRAEFTDFLTIVKDCAIANAPASPVEFDYGAVVGTVKIVGVSKTSKSYFAHRGYFHWLLESPRRIRPISTKGQRGWFTVQI